MRKFVDKDNQIGVENIFSLENSEYKDNKEFEELEKEKYEDELYFNLE